MNQSQTNVIHWKSTKIAITEKKIYSLIQILIHLSIQ